MSKKTAKRWLALLLTLVMLAGGIFPISAASTPGANEDGSLQEVSSSLKTESYLKYEERYKDAATPKQSITVAAKDYLVDDSQTTAGVEIVKDYNGRSGESLKVGATGKVTWKINVPETGLYALDIEYISVTDKTNSIERTLYINGSVPFTEARYLLMTKSWTHDYNEENGRFDLDLTQNELRPTTEVLHEWKTYTFKDSNGYIIAPLKVYLEAGENTFTLEGVREEAVFGNITFYPYEGLPSYADVLKEYEQKGYQAAPGDATVRIEAELPTKVSSYTIYPAYDRTSAITYPQHATLIKLNSIGGDKWKTAGQWVEYTFTAEATGLYNIVTRFKQSELNGLYVTRGLKINGEVPFEEANYCQFKYENKWNVEGLNNGGDAFIFYFEEGKTYTVSFEVSLGYMGDIIAQITDVLNAINNDYLAILKLTGAAPDEYRDYNFGGVMPETIRDIGNQAKVVRNIISYLTEMNDVKGANITTLEQCAILLEKMASDEDEVAKNLSKMKDYVGSLGNWISTVQEQALTFDFIQISPLGTELPKADANFFESLWYQLKQFIGSFFADYNNLGTTVEYDNEISMVEVWFTTGRDQAQIVRNLVDNNYQKEHPDAMVSLKLVAGGTLLPSILAGAGPDLSLGEGASIDYAIRGAIQPLNDFENFDEVIKRFSVSAIIGNTLYGKTYMLPDTQSFEMLFYRKDILENLGLEIPRTWDELLAMIPVLQFNNMEIALSSDYRLYLYQMGGDLWTDDGMRINLDSNTALNAFEMMTNMFTQYTLPVNYDFANRFKTGEIPIGIANYTTYNQLILFASELSGLWGFTVLPGIEQEDGTINNVGISGAGGICMISDAKEPEKAWQFMDWYTDKFFQVNYSNELVAVMGPAAKNATANIAALEELDWTAEEYRELYAQFTNLTGIPPYVGGYIIDRYTGFAFLAAVNEYKNPVDELLGYIGAINKEITRKRKEFNLETLDAGDTLASKRMRQTKEFLENELSDADRAKYADCVTFVLEKVNAAHQEGLVEAIDKMKATDATVFEKPIAYLEKAVEMLEHYKK